MSINLTITVSVVWLLLFSGCKKSHYSLNSKAFKKYEDISEQQVFNQFNLEYLALGRNSLEVESLMGAPEGRSLGSNGDFLLDYRRPVKDDEEGKIYDWSLITFYFNQGICTSLVFTLANKPEQLSEDRPLSNQN